MTFTNTSSLSPVFHDRIISLLIFCHAVSFQLTILKPKRFTSIKSYDKEISPQSKYYSSNSTLFFDLISKKIICFLKTKEITKSIHKLSKNAHFFCFLDFDWLPDPNLKFEYLGHLVTEFYEISP
jgi:hypothetical protein